MVAGGRRVLLVEDQEAVRQSLERALRFSAYAVTAVATARDAQEAILSHPVDLLVADISLGVGMDGQALSMWVRGHRPGMPVILISGSSGPQLSARVHHDPSMRVIAKPFGMATLLATISDLLDGQAAPALVLSETG